jgi:hypothetical protein
MRYVDKGKGKKMKIEIDNKQGKDHAKNKGIMPLGLMGQTGNWTSNPLDKKELTEHNIKGECIPTLISTYDMKRVKKRRK